MEVLVDTSVWIDYFKGAKSVGDLDILIDENLVVMNDIVLAELVPYLKIKRQSKVIKLLQDVKRLPLEINWHEIIEFQYVCLKSGANGVGIPDLLIAQHALQHGYAVYSLDKHFKLLNQLLKLKLYSIED